MNVLPWMALIVSSLGKAILDVTSLFNFAAGLAVFLFILVTVLIFVFIYDNLRRGKRTEATAT
jgi:cbb3-type cytochrome oxidase subunit 3